MHVARIARLAVAFCLLLSTSNSTVSAWTLDNEDLRLTAPEGTKYTTKHHEIDLQEGMILVHAHDPVNVKTPLGHYKLKRNGLALFRVKPGRERCFVLLEDVHSTFHHHHVSMRAGEELVLTDHAPVYNDIIVEDDIGRRRIRLHKLTEKLGMALTEFSLVQAMEREPLIYEVCHSHDSDDKSVKEKLIKMAAVLTMVTGRHGQYSSGARWR